MHWGCGPNTRVIRIDIDEDEFDRIASPAIRLHADARETLVALNGALEDRRVKLPSRESELTALKHQQRAEMESALPQVAT